MKTWTFTPSPTATLRDHRQFAKFVLVGAKEVQAVVDEAAKRLPPPDGAFNGYQSADPSRVRQSVRAIYEAVLERRLRYRGAPWSSTSTNQEVRPPTAVLRDGGGCCLDMVALLAAALHHVALYPLVAVVGDSQGPDHAALPCWVEANVAPIHWLG